MAFGQHSLHDAAEQYADQCQTKREQGDYDRCHVSHPLKLAQAITVLTGIRRLCGGELLLLLLVVRSGSGRKADMPNRHVECPLMTQSGHSGGWFAPRP